MFKTTLSPIIHHHHYHEIGPEVRHKGFCQFGKQRVGKLLSVGERERNLANVPNAGDSISVLPPRSLSHVGSRRMPVEHSDDGYATLIIS